MIPQSDSWILFLNTCPIEGNSNNMSNMYRVVVNAFQLKLTILIQGFSHNLGVHFLVIKIYGSYNNIMHFWGVVIGIVEFL